MMADEMAQIPLDLPHKPSFEWEDFVVSHSNEAAFGTLDSWPDWPHHAVALIGPQSSGKSHLSSAWLKRADAVRIDISQELDRVPEGRSILVEDADTVNLNETALFHVFNWTKENGSSLLITAKTPPNRWSVALPDLRSRLATVHIAEIKEPDDHLLMVLLVKLFSDRQLQVDLSVISYVLPRIERSFDAAKALVEQLDRLALAEKRKITRALAKACLDA